MNRRTVGMGLMSAGVILVLVSAAGLAFDRPDDAVAGPASSTTTITLITTTTAPTTTTTTVAEPTSSSTEADTTTNTGTVERVDEVTLVEEFIPMYRIAIQLGNIDFLFDRLHPEVLNLSTPELCRDFIEREILQLQEYEQIGPVQGPEVRDLGSGLESVYTVPVSFVFQGTSFESTASYAVVEGEVRWFTECRA